MNMFKVYKVLMGHRFSQLWENKFYFFYEFLTPFAYGAVFFFQAIFVYSTNNSAFPDLNRNEYILGIIISQIVFMLGNYNGFILLAEEIINSQFDFVLLRPIQTAFYKYLRGWDPITTIMCIGYILAGFIVGLVINIPLLIGLKLILFTICAALIRVNFFGFATGWIFFLRNWNHVYKIDGIISTAQNAPREVFTAGFRFILTYMLPAIVIMGFGFEVIRGRDSLVFWAIVTSWLAFCMLANHFMWKRGIKNYESFS